MFQGLNTRPTNLVWLILTTFFSVAGLNVSAQLSSPEPIQLLTNAAQVRALSLAEAERKLPVKLRAVVTTLDPAHSVFLQDETGGTFLNKPGSATPFVSGDILEIEGTTYSGYFVPG